MENTEVKRTKTKPLGENQGKILICLPERLYNDFKDYCKANKTKMAQTVRQLITDKISG